jgi:hypothetical protein
MKTQIGYRQRLARIRFAMREVQSMHSTKTLKSLRRLNDVFSLIDLRVLAEELNCEPIIVGKLARESCFHENGFWKLVIGDSGLAKFKIRVHYWPRPSAGDPVPENIHNHRFDCYSRIAAGSLKSTSWKISRAGHDFRHYHYYPQTTRKSYTLAYKGEERLEPTESASHNCGEVYFMRGTDLHTAGAIDETVTVFLEQRARLRRYADVFSMRYARRDVSLPDGALTSDQYLRILRSIAKLVS